MPALLTVILYFVAWGIDTLTGISGARTLVTIPLLFVIPGFSLVTITTGKRYALLERLLIGTTISLPLLTLPIYLVYTIWNQSLTLNFVLASSLGIITLLGFLEATLHIRKELPRWPRRTQIETFILNHRPLWFAASVYILVHCVSFFIYPFIPEADGYGVLARVERTIHTGIIGNAQYRPLLTVTAIIFHFLSGTSLTLLFKWLIPLVWLTVIIPLYLTSRTLKLPPLLTFLSSVTPLAVPVIFQETEIVRTQSYLILSSFTVLWLLIRHARTGSFTALLYALAIALVSIFFHEIAYLLLVTVLISALPLYLRSLRHHPIHTLSYSFLVVIATFPYIQELGLLDRLRPVLNPLREMAAKPHFEWWFIDHYRNADGAETGWPGWQALLYYGYNLGILLPATILFTIILRRVRLTLPKELLPIYIFGGINFALAEITPRLGGTVLPDRSWLFLSIALCVTIPYIFRSLPHTRFILFFLSLATLLSITASIAVTYIKQGWVTRAEYQAALWLQHNTPANTLVLSQDGNGPLLIHYAKRIFYPRTLFFFLPYSAQTATLDNLTDNPRQVFAVQAAPADTNKDQASVLKEIQDQGRNLSTVTSEQAARDLIANLNQDLLELESLRASVPAISKESLNTNQPVYILYSYDKFRTFYGQRAWWREMNGYGANANTLDTLPHTNRVFDQNGVTIWKYEESR